jgi:RNA-splicing ligase RtcB
VIVVRGACNTAICYCADLDPGARDQIQAVCDQPVFAGSVIRIMPDVHVGMGSTIGTTMTVTDKVVPGIVGVDIGCGMETVRIAERQLDCRKLDTLIRAEIPCGREVRATPHPMNDEVDLSQLRCVRHLNLTRARRSVGTLGGGNHFIEVDRGGDGALYLVIHSGSRRIGNEVAGYYQDEGFRTLCGNARTQIDETIAKLKEEGKAKEIHKTIQRMKKRQTASLPKDLAYVEGQLFDDYLHDMKIIQRFATLNRKAMASVILRGMGLTAEETFTTIHNYIDTDTMILRKGAVSARLGEKLLIPINMRDGSLICTGKGNADWNCSAPHGAGRLMSRAAAFKTLSLQAYQDEMRGIFTTCVNADTLDESPMSYKNMDDIVAQIAPTAEILDRIRPLYNFKASE